MRKAYSYARFSTSTQADGFSLARQLEAAKAYCSRNGLTLDERSFADHGVSGYRGSNSQAGELAEFIGLVQQGRIPRGSVLIVENTDRLSRLPPNEANGIITGIVKAGVDVVTISPEAVYTASNIDKIATWLPLQVSQCLAHEESEKKSARLKDAWQRKRDALAEKKKMSKHGPAWLRLNADRAAWSMIQDKVEMVRQVFRWCIEGIGVSKMCEGLHERWPNGLTGKGWQPAQVATLLRNRAVLGEYQPHVGTCAKKGGIKSTRQRFGDPIRKYFPPIVKESEFYLAQQALSARRKGGGRVQGTPNLFNGCLWNALDGQKMIINGSHGAKILISAGAVRRTPGSAFRSIRYDDFERTILSYLRELKPRDVVGKATAAEDAVEEWSGKLSAVNHNIAQANQRAAKADDPSVYLDLLDEYGKQRKQIIARLDKAKEEAASQASDNLGEAISLIKLMDGTDNGEREELRRKIKAAIRRLVEGIWVVVATQGRDRLAAVQIWFRGGAKQRSYLIHYRQKTKSNDALWQSLSLADGGKLGELDLRKQADARKLEKWLAVMNIDDWAHPPDA